MRLLSLLRRTPRGRPRGDGRPSPEPLLAVVVVVVAWVLRLLRLGDANLGWDEALGVWVARKGLLDATIWAAGDAHPPLHFWLVWGWIRLVGESEFAVRALAAAVGTLTVAAVYVLGARLAGRRTGLVAALLTALARFHLQWSQDLRMYALGGLLAVLATYLLVRWIHGWAGVPRGAAVAGAGWGTLVLYTVAAAGALHTLYLMGALLLGHNVVVAVALVSHEAGRAGPQGGAARLRIAGWWAASQMAVLALFGAWLLVAWGRMKTSTVGEAPTLGWVARLYGALLATGLSTHVERYTWIALAVTGVTGLGCVLHGLTLWRRGERGPLLALAAVALGALAPVGAVYAATRPGSPAYSPRMEARYFAPFAPLAWTLLAVALVAVWRRRRPAVLSVLWGAIALGASALWVAALPGHYAGRVLRDDLQTMVRAIVSQAEAGDVVLLDSGSRFPVFLYAYERIPAAGGRPEVVPISPSGERLGGEEAAALCTGTTAGHGRVWLAEVEPHLSDPDHHVRAWLDGHLHRACGLAYGPHTLYLYAPEGRPPRLRAPEEYAAQHPLARWVGGDGLLRGWELAVDAVRPGEALRVALLWERRPAGEVIVSLVGAGDALVSERRLEAEPTAWPLREEALLMPMPGTAPGTYGLVLAAGSEEIRLGSARVVGGGGAPAAAEPETPLRVLLMGGIALEGYTLRDATGRPPGVLRPGDALLLDLYWRAERPVEGDLVVFTHLLGVAYNPRTQGPVWGQHDARPLEGAYPAALWRAGERVVDRHRIPIDADAPSGTYRLEVGMYRAEDGARLTVTSDGASSDHVLLPAEVRVEKGTRMTRMNE